MTGFNNVFEESLVDYSKDFEKQDKLIVKEQIKNWIEEHCSFSANLDSTNNSNSNTDDYEITDDLVINVFSNINIRSEENFPDIIKFGKVAASFFMMGQKLTKTNGFPDEIGESLWMYDNCVEDITDFPSHIGGNCCLRHNKIKNLNGVSLEIGGNLDVCDNDNFDYSPRTDGQTIKVGVSFYGSLDNDLLESNKNKESKYVKMGGDKDEKNIAFAKYLDDIKCPITIGTNSKNGYIWHSKGDI